MELPLIVLLEILHHSSVLAMPPPTTPAELPLIVLFTWSGPNSKS